MGITVGEFSLELGVMPRRERAARSPRASFGLAHPDTVEPRPATRHRYSGLAQSVFRLDGAVAICVGI